jgi:hypothetical protein
VQILIRINDKLLKIPIWLFDMRTDEILEVSNSRMSQLERFEWRREERSQACFIYCVGSELDSELFQFREGLRIGSERERLPGPGVPCLPVQ